MRAALGNSWPLSAEREFPRRKTAPALSTDDDDDAESWKKLQGSGPDGRGLLWIAFRRDVSDGDNVIK